MYLFEENDIRKHVKLDQTAIQLIEGGFTQLAAGNVTLPPIMRIDVPEHNGEVDVKSAYIKGLDSFALKISSGFFNNPSLGLPSLSGMMMLFQSKTGLPEAVLLDNGYLTDVRTAAAGAVAANHLVKQKLQYAGVIGTGLQARLQMHALYAVRPFKAITVFGRSEEAVRVYASEMEKALGVTVRIAASPEQVVKESEAVVTTTPSKQPLIKANWIHPGLHITAMGSDAEHKQELEAQVFTKADVIVCDVKSQCFRLGELHHAKDQGILSEETESILELGELTSMKKTGRQNESQVTVCDLTGTGVQDTVIARFAYEQLKTRGRGLVLGKDTANTK
ncbi:cyclodeaminase [Bacillus gobiensis]|uniref:cyclodeaminase n=1 Tax=Bacillus gobiensis TaxID=1441095 RepID=UPI003D249DF2